MKICKKLINDLIRVVDLNLLDADYKTKIDYLYNFTGWEEWEDILSNLKFRRKLSENFIRKFKDKVDWKYISAYQILSENFIKEFQNKVRWNFISYYQKLSEDFIREFQDRVSWYDISLKQDISDNFIIEFKNKINLQWFVMSNKHISEKVMRAYGVDDI